METTTATLPTQPLVQADNLVIFSFMSNDCWPKVSRTVPECITIDLEQGTWTLSDDYWKRTQTFKIGEHSHSHDRQSVFGVYDRTNDEHLALMVHAGPSIIRDRSSRGGEGED